MTNNKGKELEGIVPEGLEFVSREHERMTRYDHYLCAALTGLCANTNRKPGDSTRDSHSSYIKSLVRDANTIATEAIKQRDGK